MAGSAFGTTSVGVEVEALDADVVAECHHSLHLQVPQRSLAHVSLDICTTDPGQYFHGRAKLILYTVGSSRATVERICKRYVTEGSGRVQASLTRTMSARSSRNRTMRAFCLTVRSLMSSPLDASDGMLRPCTAARTDTSVQTNEYRRTAVAA